MRQVTKVLSSTLVAAAAVGIGLFMAFALPRTLPAAPPDPETPSADTVVHTGRLPGYESAPQNTTPEYFWYLYNGNLSAASDGCLAVLLENTPGNDCAMQVRYTLPDGTVLFTTPRLQPGEYLLNAYPETLPAAGSYGVTLTMLVYHEEQDPAAEEPFATYTEQATLTVPQDAALRPA